MTGVRDAFATSAMKAQEAFTCETLPASRSAASVRMVWTESTMARDEAWPQRWWPWSPRPSSNKRAATGNTGESHPAPSDPGGEFLAGHIDGRASGRGDGQRGLGEQGRFSDAGPAGPRGSPSPSRARRRPRPGRAGPVGRRQGRQPRRPKNAMGVFAALVTAAVRPAGRVGGAGSGGL